MKRSSYEDREVTGEPSESDNFLKQNPSTSADGSTTTTGHSVKNILRRSLELKRQRKLDEEASVVVENDIKIEEEGLLKKWADVLRGSGYFCDILQLNHETIFHTGVDKICGTSHFCILAVHPLKCLYYHEVAGAFKDIQLVFLPDGQWRLQSPILEYAQIECGSLSTTSCDGEELINVVNKYLSPNFTLCPGLPGMEDIDLKLGYLPKPVKVIGSTIKTIRSKSCKIWHIPGSNRKLPSGEDLRWHRVCGECMITHRYVQKAIENKQSVDYVKKFKRRKPSSNYPVKFLSPKSKTVRSHNGRMERSRLRKQVKKLYKVTQIELPEDQSKELCALIESIEGNESGRSELEKITKEGNKYIDKKGVKTGDCLKEVWAKDRESFYKDQRSNVTGKKSNKWSVATIRLALAVYTRSPSAYEALRDMKILQLPCSKKLKKVIKDGSEKPGIDEEYLFSQSETYKQFQIKREEQGHPRPLGLGVMIWDEVKIQMKVACNMKGAGILGYSTDVEELPVLQDVYQNIVQSAPQKATYEVQFLWRDLTSGYDLVGPHFPVPHSIDANILQEFVMLCTKAFTSYGFKIAIILCDGASSNLSLLKILAGYPKAQLPYDGNANSASARYHVDASFVNPEDPYGSKIFLMICPSHQLKNMIAALYSSRLRGKKNFTHNGVSFGWHTIEQVFAEDIERANNNLSRKVPGLKYAFVYRDSWTRLNVRPAKIMQQRYMIAAIKEISREPNQEPAEKTSKYLEACHLIFEKGLLSHARINSNSSPVLLNIQQGMAFFEDWCLSHQNTAYADNTKKARQKRFLAWQTWDLLRMVVHGFLSFCKWFFTIVSSNGRYFVSPLRINGSALESIFSVLKYSTGGNLSGLSYGPALGKLINRKDQAQNKYSEKGYRDVQLNLDGQCDLDGIPIQVLKISQFLCTYSFPSHISQSTIGDRQGSNACTIISVKFGTYCFQNKLDISLYWTQLPHLWFNCFINALCDGNQYYDELFSETPDVLLDVDDVVNSLGHECQVNSANQLFGFNNANNYNNLIDHIQNVATSAHSDSYGVIIGSDRAVGLLVKSNGQSAIIDSHRHIVNNVDTGGEILMAANPKEIILEYTKTLRQQGITLRIGTLTWIKYDV